MQSLYNSGENAILQLDIFCHKDNPPVSKNKLFLAESLTKGILQTPLNITVKAFVNSHYTDGKALLQRTPFIYNIKYEEIKLMPKEKLHCNQYSWFQKVHCM